MPRKKFIPDNEVAYDPAPVCVKVLPGVRQQLKAVDDWQAKTRLFWQGLIDGERGAKAP